MFALIALLNCTFDNFIHFLSFLLYRFYIFRICLGAEQRIVDLEIMLKKSQEEVRVALFLS